MKTALLFVDDEVVKIALGDTLKCIKFAELRLAHNVSYMERLFASANVLMVEKAEALAKEGFDEFVDGVFATVAEPAAEPETESEAEAGEAEAPAAKPRPSQRPRAEPEEGHLLYRSTAESVIIVDDLPTGEELPNMPGTFKTLAVVPYRAVNLNLLDPEKVRKSTILKRLIRDGTLVPCTPREADRMLLDYEVKIREENDARLASMSPIIEGESAAAYAERVSGGRTRAPLGTHEAETIEVTEEEAAPSKPRKLSMEELMQAVGAADDEQAAAPQAPPPRRELTQRPKTEVLEGNRASGIKKAHKPQ